MWSRRPEDVSHASQSAAWILLWVSVTVVERSGQFLRWAYIRTVMDVQAPRAASSRSYGVGPRSSPPDEAGSSAVRVWRPARICWVNAPSAESVTTTAAGMELMSGPLSAGGRYRSAQAAITVAA